MKLGIDLDFFGDEVMDSSWINHKIDIQWNKTITAEYTFEHRQIDNNQIKLTS